MELANFDLVMVPTEGYIIGQGDGNISNDWFNFGRAFTIELEPGVPSEDICAHFAFEYAPGKTFSNGPGLVLDTFLFTND